MMIHGDYHTHSTYSKLRHGKNTIAEMVQSAKDKGLENIAITDHGPKHLGFGIKRKNIDKARKEIDSINEKGELEKVYLGIEANLIGKDGKIDLTQEEIDKLDLLIVGFHRGTFNNIVKPFGILPRTKKQIEKQTKAYVDL
ncbi:MAG: PHP domain-containing protein, partial [Clostridia bacterium]|nr:PHP domain-containing protein [Clostridia bacterium]